MFPKAQIPQFLLLIKQYVIRLVDPKILPHWAYRFQTEKKNFFGDSDTRLPAAFLKSAKSRCFLTCLTNLFCYHSEASKSDVVQLT